MNNKKVLDCSFYKKRVKKICKSHNEPLCKIYKNLLQQCYTNNMIIYYENDIKFIL